jgi:hypothetical protein
VNRLRTQQILCGVAIALFVAFVWSRGLQWASLEYGQVRALADRGFALDTDHYPFKGSSWDLLGTTATWIYAALLVIPNMLFVLWHRRVDPLVPSLANTGVGALLAALTIFFIANPDAIEPKQASGGVIWRWTLESGAYPALAFALGIVVVGVIQGYLRNSRT